MFGRKRASTLPELDEDGGGVKPKENPGIWVYLTAGVFPFENDAGWLGDDLSDLN